MIDLHSILKNRITAKASLSFPSVYILIKREQIVYIGSTNNPKSRLSCHKRDKQFDYFSLIQCGSMGEAQTLEKLLISKFKPCYNKFGVDDFANQQFIENTIAEYTLRFVQPDIPNYLKSTKPVLDNLEVKVSLK